MDVYNPRRQGVTQSDDALGWAGFTFNGIFADVAACVFARRDTRDMASHGIYLIVRTQLTDSAYGLTAYHRNYYRNYRHDNTYLFICTPAGSYDSSSYDRQ